MSNHVYSCLRGLSVELRGFLTSIHSCLDIYIPVMSSVYLHNRLELCILFFNITRVTFVRTKSWSGGGGVCQQRSLNPGSA